MTETTPPPPDPTGIGSDGRRRAHPDARVAVITGASSGIGEATARLLASRGGWSIVLVARRDDRLAGLGHELACPTSSVAVDLTDGQAPTTLRRHLESEYGGRVDLLVNNAGAAWRGDFATAGYENVQRTMELNFDATVRVSEALLPLLRASAPSSIVNVASTAGRVARAGSGAYSASKFALAGWTDALHAEEKPHGVHVGLVLPGFIRTEGFPAEELRERALTRWIVSDPKTAAAAILEAGPGGKAERYVPRPYALAAIARILVPGLLRRLQGGVGGQMLVTKTGADAADAAETAVTADDEGNRPGR